MNAERTATIPTAMSDLGDAVSDAPGRVERLVQRHQRSISAFTRIGWLAKGIVYILFGVTAIAIARQSSPSEEASPQGALGQVLDAPAGRLLMATMALGLVLYSIWRAASVVLVDGSDLTAWGDRLGYTFSAIFYALLGFTAGRSAMNGSGPDDSNTVESVSRTLLESTVGRWALAIGGIVTMGVGAYFLIRKGVLRSFVDDLTGIDEDGDGHDASDHAIYIAGIIGWVARGGVTALVGYFVVRAAVTFDPDEARGFDRALREAATTTTGSILVWISAIGLVAYGSFCILSHRRRSLGDADARAR